MSTSAVNRFAGRERLLYTFEVLLGYRLVLDVIFLIRYVAAHDAMLTTGTIFEKE